MRISIGVEKIGVPLPSINNLIGKHFWQKPLVCLIVQEISSPSFRKIKAAYPVFRTFNTFKCMYL